jgi:plastocyanin
MNRILLVTLSLMLAFVFPISLTRSSFAEKEEDTKQTTSSQKNQFGTSQIGIENFSFTPSTITVRVGTKVTWINHDDVPHIVMDTDKHFVSPVLDADQQFSYKFVAPGTYTYYCSIHPKMTARVIVK